MGNIKKTRSKAKAAEPACPALTEKSIDVDNMARTQWKASQRPHLSGWGTWKKAVIGCYAILQQTRMPVTDPSFDNRWKETEAKKNKVIDNDRLMVLSNVVLDFTERRNKGDLLSKTRKDEKHLFTTSNPLKPPLLQACDLLSNAFLLQFTSNLV